MQIILIQDVPHLGSLGDEVYVKDGYARNYLLPRGMAIRPNARRTGEIDHQRKRLEKQRQEAIEKAQSESDKVAALEIVVHAKAGASGKLFGSVTNRDVQAALAEQGYELDRRSIGLHTPIKNLGAFAATVKLHTDVKVDIAIRVEALLEKDGSGAAETAEEGSEGTAGAEAPGGESAEAASGGEAAEAAGGEEGGAEAAEAAAGEHGGAEAAEAASGADAPATDGDATPEPLEAQPESAAEAASQSDSGPAQQEAGEKEEQDG